ncbi:hypothetical protein MMC25_002137 [Agyrium rufum]|nr:hypothetical protein [Agyrium rufum]
MDPVTAIGLVAAVKGLVEVAANTVSGFIKLKRKFNNTDLNLNLLISQLSTVKAALDQISCWISSYLIQGSHHQQLVLDLGIALEGCKLLMAVLDASVSHISHESGTPLQLQAKIHLLWEEAGMRDHVSLLNNQNLALNLLLTALNCRTIFKQRDLLQKQDSRRTMNQVEDDTASIRAMSDVASSVFSAPAMTASPSRIELVMAQSIGIREQAPQSFHAMIDSRAGTNSPLSIPDQSTTNSGTGDAEAGRKDFVSDLRGRSGTLRQRFSSADTAPPYKPIPAIEAGPPTKILFLGSSGGGQSTLIRFLEWVFNFEHGQPDPIALKTYVSTIRDSLIEELQILWHDIKIFQDPRFADLQSIEFGAITRAQLQFIPIDELITSLSCLTDEPIHRTCRKRSELSNSQLTDAASHYLDHCENSFTLKYMLSSADVLHLYARTTGISRTEIKVGNTGSTKRYALVDVGGARSERKKWLDTFPGTNAIVFTIDLTSFDRILWENETATGLHEELMLFESIIRVNTDHISTDVPIILVFTKMELLRKQHDLANLRKDFPNFDEIDGDSAAAATFITKLFEACLPLDSLARFDALYFDSVEDDLEALSTTLMDCIENAMKRLRS